MTNSDIDMTNSDIDMTNSDIDMTSSDIDMTNSDIDMTNSDIDMTSFDIDMTNSDIDIKCNSYLLTPLIKSSNKEPCLERNERSMRKVFLGSYTTKEGCDDGIPCGQRAATRK
jgi:hypothetical protein